MKRFLGFVRKEFIHIFRDTRTLIILFGIPAAQILIFGFAVRTDIKNAGVAVLDKSKDEVTTQIINKIESSEFLILEKILQSEAQIDQAFKEGNIKEVLWLFG